MWRFISFYTGRPTKKERREIDRFSEEAFDIDFDEFDFDTL